MTTSSDNHFVAQAVHDLGSALWFGGAVMGIAGAASFPLVLAGFAGALATALLAGGPRTVPPRAIAEP